jgi:hypothetical protein
VCDFVLFFGVGTTAFADINGFGVGGEVIKKALIHEGVV